jgi:hypothetical protein
MLREVPPSYHARGRPHRWFTDEHFDLIVWTADSAAVLAFELCYDQSRHERALIWSADAGYEHFRVDAGEDSAVKNRTPILVSDGSFPKARVIADFTQASVAIDSTVRDSILRKLQAFPH